MVTKVCNGCKETKPLAEFFPKNDCRYGVAGTCKVCARLKRKDYYKDTKAEPWKKYEKTLNGYLMRSYRNMTSRVKGILKKKAHLYEGLDILPKEEFYAWSLNSNYPQLLEAYKESGYDAKLAPSVDRIDSSRGYVLDNMRWVTHSENSRLGSVNRNKGYKNET